MNITEFAKIADVSKAAVSRYFNNGYLSADKREKIRAAAEKTGYSPSIQAQNIRTSRTRLIGVIIPKLSSESCARITDGISCVLTEAGYQLILANTGNSPEKEVEYLDIFRQNRVDGVIFLASIFTPEHERVLKSMRIPVVISGQECKGFNCVCHDDYGAAKALTALMLSKGRQTPAYIGVTTLDGSAGLARRDGYLAALEERKIPFLPQYMSISEFSMDSGYAQAEKLFSARKPPDCIFCATDSIAVGAEKYCLEHGISVPTELMIASVGDTKLGRVTAVPLTSAHLHYHTAGREAARMLLSSLEQKNNFPHTVKFDFDIIERLSTETV